MRLSERISLVPSQLKRKVGGLDPRSSDRYANVSSLDRYAEEVSRPCEKVSCGSSAAARNPA
jgi:hypothetical protein